MWPYQICTRAHFDCIFILGEQGEWTAALSYLEQAKVEGLELTNLWAPCLDSLEALLISNNQPIPWEVSASLRNQIH